MASMIEPKTVGRLPSGRSVLVRVTDSGEEMEVRTPTGEVEVRIHLTADGPVVRLSGARLELASAEDVAIRCGRFEVHATEGIRLQTDGEARLGAEGNVHVNGAVVHLNC